MIILPGQAEVHTKVEGVPGHELSPADILLAKRVAELLNKHYPYHLWAVHVNSEGGILTIKDMAVSSIYGYVLHLKTIYADPLLKCVVKAGGEILERAGLARKAWYGDMPKYVEGIPDNKQPFKAFNV